MTDFTLVVPDDIVERARRIANSNAQSVEAVLIHQLQQMSASLPPLPADTQSELDVMRAYSDEALETIATTQLSPALAERARHLGRKNSLGTITATEHDELSALVELGDRQMLRKAQAMALLVERGRSLQFAQGYRNEWHRSRNGPGCYDI
jgi:hypothetical protein